MMPTETPPPLSKELEINEKELHKAFEHCDDVVYRPFAVGQTGQRAVAVFVSDLVNKTLVESIILRELMIYHGGPSPMSIKYLHDQLVSSSQLSILTNWSEVLTSILTGQVVVMIHGDESALAIDEISWEHRAVEKPENEVSIRGSQASFTESMMNNIALIRRHLPDARLKIEKYVIGEVTHTPYCILYLQGTADPQIIDELKTRLNSKKADKILDIGYIEELIRDHIWSPFPTVVSTERPDRVVAQLLDGRVAMLLENSPNALTVPSLFVEFFQVPEDYYQNFILQSSIRVLRYGAFWLATLLSSFYVMLLTYNHEVLPDSLLSSLVAQRSGVPLPTIIEVLLMEGTFEVLREAGLRLPRTIGQAISIVGALVIGQAAVQAGIVMASTVIVVATTGILTFTIANYGMAGAVRLVRFPMLLITGLFGLPGLAVGLFILLLHLMSLRSFGVIYTAGFSPWTWQDVKDTVGRAPLQIASKTRWIGRAKGTDQTAPK